VADAGSANCSTAQMSAKPRKRRLPRRMLRQYAADRATAIKRPVCRVWTPAGPASRLFAHERGISGGPVGRGLRAT
jgi:hypothetical protein